MAVGFFFFPRFDDCRLAINEDVFDCVPAPQTAILSQAENLRSLL
jgi:hypothetical protein